MSAPVWTGLDLHVQVYPADPVTGEAINQLLLSYCFFENASLYGGINWVQRPGFGNPVRNLVSEDEYDLFTLSVEHFYTHYSEVSIEDIFNRDALLYLEMYLVGPSAGLTGKTSEFHVMKKARGVNFRLGFADNQNAEGQVNFIAPIYTRPVGPPAYVTLGG